MQSYYLSISHGDDFLRRSCNVAQCMAPYKSNFELDLISRHEKTCDENKGERSQRMSLTWAERSCRVVLSYCRYSDR